MNLMDIKEAQANAQKRTGRLLGTSIKKGKWNVVDVVYDKKGNSTVTYLLKNTTPVGAMAFLNSLGVNHER